MKLLDLDAYRKKYKKYRYGNVVPKGAACGSGDGDGNGNGDWEGYQYEIIKFRSL